MPDNQVSEEFNIQWIDRVLLVSRHKGAQTWFEDKLKEWAGGQEEKTLYLHKIDHLSPEDIEKIKSYDVVVGNIPMDMARHITENHRLRYFYIILPQALEQRKGEINAADMTEMGAKLQEYKVITPAPSIIHFIKSSRPYGATIKEWLGKSKWLVFMVFIISIFTLSTALEAVMQEMLQIITAIRCEYLKDCRLSYHWDWQEFWFTLLAVVFCAGALLMLNFLKSMIVNVIVSNKSTIPPRKMLVMGLSTMTTKQDGNRPTLKTIADFSTDNKFIGLAECYFGEKAGKHHSHIEGKQTTLIKARGLPPLNLAQDASSDDSDLNTLLGKINGSTWQQSIRAMVTRLDDTRLIYMMPSCESGLQLPGFLNMLASLFENTATDEGLPNWQVQRNDCYREYWANVDCNDKCVIEKKDHQESKGEDNSGEDAPKSTKQESAILYIYSLGTEEDLSNIKKTLADLNKSGKKGLVLLYHRKGDVDYENFDQVYSGLLAAATTAAEFGYQEKDICIDVTAGQKTFSIAAAVATMNRSMIYSYINHKNDLKVFDGHIQIGDSYK